MDLGLLQPPGDSRPVLPQKRASPGRIITERAAGATRFTPFFTAGLASPGRLC